MKNCPVCGYDPDPVENPPSMAELKSQQLRNLFSKNLQNSWWLTQPDMVCKWLKNSGVNPYGILDIGCGDARWLPAIAATWPGAGYLGVDRIAEHQELNKENFPDYAWPTDDICALDTEELRKYSTVFLMGVFNPLMQKNKQEELISKVKSIAPQEIVVLFDLNQTGTMPHAQFESQYRLKLQLEVPPGLQGFKQNDVVWLYGK